MRREHEVPCLRVVMYFAGGHVGRTGGSGDPWGGSHVRSVRRLNVCCGRIFPLLHLRPAALASPMSAVADSASPFPRA